MRLSIVVNQYFFYFYGVFLIYTGLKSDNND